MNIEGKNLHNSTFLVRNSIFVFFRLTPRILEPLSPLDRDFTRFNNYLSLYSFKYQPNLSEMI